MLLLHVNHIEYDLSSDEVLFCSKSQKMLSKQSILYRFDIDNETFLTKICEPIEKIKSLRSIIESKE